MKYRCTESFGVDTHYFYKDHDFTVLTIRENCCVFEDNGICRVADLNSLDKHGYFTQLGNKTKEGVFISAVF